MTAEKTITDYICITANTGSKLSEKVNNLLAENDGWQPLGTVAMAEWNHATHFSQAMVRYEGVASRGAKI